MGPEASTATSSTIDLNKATIGEGAYQRELPGMPQELFEKYKFSLSPDGVATFTLPSGMTHRQLINDCEAYCKASPWHKHPVIQPSAAILDVYLDRIPARDYTQPVSVKIVDVTGRRNSQYEELHKLGLSFASFGDAIAAAALYYCKTGGDFLGGVRTESSGLFLMTGFRWDETDRTTAQDGLRAMYDFDGRGYRDIGCAAEVPQPRQA